MTPRTRKLLAICLIVLIIGGVGTATYFLFIRKTDPAMRIRDIAGNGAITHGDYSRSCLYIYPNGAFDIELIETISEGEHKIIFTGVGTYTKNKNQYVFTYAGSFASTGAQFEPNHVETYDIIKGRVLFTFRAYAYYFGR